MKLYETLEKQLKNEPNFVSDNGILKKWVILNKAQNFDQDLIAMLLENQELKQKFFMDIEGTLVFNQNLFMDFLEQKNYLNDSYTQYRNKVGFAIGDKHLKQRNEISLVWPFKDCVLEGGQSREEQEREEIFFNEILAQDEITQLLEPKVLSKAKVFFEGGEKPFSSFKRDAEYNKKRGLPENTITDNLLIKGNNLMALHSLKREFFGKVKLIYIDPPFNTGKDEFNYNDRFNHSTWLTFMKNRLQAAKELLKEDGIMVVHVGNEEAAYIQVLLDEVFNRENYLNHITMSTNPPSGFKATSSKIFSTANHIFFYGKNLEHSELNKLHVPKGYDTAYKYYLINPEDDFSKWKYCNIIDEIARRLGYEDTKTLKKSVSKSELLKKTANFAHKNNNRVFRTAAVGGGARKKRKKTIEKSKENRGVVMQHPGEDVEGFYILNGEMIIFWSNTYKEIDGELLPGQSLTDVWTDIGFTGISSEGGVTLKNGKKPELLLKRILDLASEPGDIVLDYHLGSGTTAGVAMKMQRQFIGIEQLHYGKNDSLIRLKNVINGDKSGVSKYKDVNWKGGGSFTYFQLKKYNQHFIEEIEEAKDTKELLKIWEDMKAKSFMKYNVDIKKQEQHIEDFKALSLDDQKKHLCELLDKNQLYVNLSSLYDKDFLSSDTEKLVTQDFYQLKTK
ncbi:DNA methyltransferase [Rhodohalobacter barkolensis]|uniref:site-specific DNA-methyltransferase (adenine-specific) n=1 Tax=Rhodohalobacter barkolensis TaxID=2053187 RepID=A0A2N0VM50_9BACT|nr:site-specific DNA-methyltransferase [Rhodohalobacter barkolensis]PKD45287.1 restriction endonuclease subunit M [Rhodohalobacter barkolensis]